MTLFDLFNVLAVSAVAVAAAYTTFWALSVRKALVVPIFRRLALGTALVAAALGLLLVADTLGAYLVNHNALVAQGQGGYGTFQVLLALLFYWVDASVLAVRRSDPMGRDILHWSKLRIILWIGVLPGVVIGFLIGISTLVAGANVISPPPTNAIGNFLVMALIFIPSVSGAVALPIVATTTGDRAFRSQMMWFGLFALSFILLLVGSNLSDAYVGLMVVYLAALLGLFCLHRSVSSLVK